MFSARCGSSMIALSVISRQNASAGTWCLISNASNFCGSSRSSKSRVDRFTDSTSCRPSSCSICQWRAASSKIQIVSTRMKPVCSANGMNCIGGTRPRVGCCQRTSASAPTTVAVSSASLGCRYRRSSPSASACRSSVSSDRVCALPASMAGSYISGPAERRLALYIATSARLSSTSASFACAGQQAMPMPAPMSTLCSSSVSGASKLCSMRCATEAASSALPPRSSTANSSPPRRATRSPPRTDCWLSRSATALSSRSPKR